MDENDFRLFFGDSTSESEGSKDQEIMKLVDNKFQKNAVWLHEYINYVAFDDRFFKEELDDIPNLIDDLKIIKVIRKFVLELIFVEIFNEIGDCTLIDEGIDVQEFFEFLNIPKEIFISVVQEIIAHAGDTEWFEKFVEEEYKIWRNMGTVKRQLWGAFHVEFGLKLLIKRFDFGEGDKVKPINEQILLDTPLKYLENSVKRPIFMQYIVCMKMVRLFHEPRIIIFFETEKKKGTSFWEKIKNLFI